MNVGQTWTSPWSHFVDAGYKHNNGCATDSCTSQYEGWVQNRHQLVAQHSTYTTIWGHTVNDVIELTDPYNTESDHFFYARGYGLVGFEGPAGNNAGRWRSGAYNINPDIGGASNWVGLCDEQLPEPTPPPPPPNPGTPPGDNLALGASDWSASSVYNADFGGNKAYDGVIDAGSKWTSDGSSATSWMALDLGTNCDITGFIVRHAGAGGESAFGYRIRKLVDLASARDPRIRRFKAEERARKEAERDARQAEQRQKRELALAEQKAAEEEAIRREAEERERKRAEKERAGETRSS